jgi:tetratricopeptide (TPR) repeat protein
MNRRLAIGLIVFLAASAAFASWYDDYDVGFKAVTRGDWAVVIEKMTAAIKGNPKEDNNARTYGAIFINYHPYYYRGYAYLRTGKYDQAISDFEKTSGPGELNRGTTEALMQEAKTKLAAANTPEPQPQPRPTPVPPRPEPLPPTPVPPSVDNALRQRATAALNNAKARLTAAQQRKAQGSAQYMQAMQAYVAANSQLAGAKSNDDLNAVLAAADNVVLLADSAMPPNIPQPQPQPQPGPGGKPIPPVFGEYQQQLRRALENYYSGEFESAARDFKSLSIKLPTNGWIWAFLGASQYSYYAFESDETYKDAAMESFRKAKRYRFGKGGLPEKYFSKRIRRVFEKAG